MDSSESITNRWINFIVSSFSPNLSTENARQKEFELLKSFLSNLLQTILPDFEVHIFRYGSTPLLTYIPDGDIDVGIAIIPNENQNIEFTELEILTR